MLQFWSLPIESPHWGPGFLKYLSSEASAGLGKQEGCYSLSQVDLNPAPLIPMLTLWDLPPLCSLVPAWLTTSVWAAPGLAVDHCTVVYHRTQNAPGSRDFRIAMPGLCISG